MTTTRENPSPVALVTGASRGFGLAITRALVRDGWRAVVDARHADALDEATGELRGVLALPGDVTDAAHRGALADAVRALGRLDLLVNNASALGPSPLPALSALPAGVLLDVLDTNVVAPLALTQLLLPMLRPSRGVIVNVSSDAAVAAYARWGGYGASKAALDHASAVLGVEEPDVRVYSFDPGDMRTAMHQRAFPGEDISDRPEPEAVVPAVLWLLAHRPPSGRYRADNLIATVG